MKAYFDGSGNAKDSKAIALTGVAASDPLWASFDDKWNQILSSRKPAAPYIHMKELVSRTGAFSYENGWDEQKTNKLILDCLMYAQTLDKQDYRSFTCTVDMVAYRAIKARRLPLPSPYAICSRFGPELVLRWYVSNFSTRFPQELHYIFDQGERYRGAFEKRWILGKKSGRGFLNQWHLVKSSGTGDMANYPELQLADLIAWSHHRRLANEDSRTETSWIHLSRIAEEVLPSTRKAVSRSDLEMIAHHGLAYPALIENEFGELL